MSARANTDNRCACGAVELTPRAPFAAERPDGRVVNDIVHTAHLCGRHAAVAVPCSCGAAELRHMGEVRRVNHWYHRYGAPCRPEREERRIRQAAHIARHGRGVYMYTSPYGLVCSGCGEAAPRDHRRAERGYHWADCPAVGRS